MEYKGIIKLRNYTQVVYWRYLVLPHLYNGFWGNSNRGNFDFFSKLEIGIDREKPCIENAETDGNVNLDLTRIVHYDLNEALNLGKLTSIIVKEYHNKLKNNLLSCVYQVGSYIVETEWSVDLIQTYITKIDEHLESDKFNSKNKTKYKKDLLIGLEWILKNVSFIDKFNKQFFNKTKVLDELEDISKIIKTGNNTINSNPIIKHSLEHGYEPKDISRIKEYVKEAGGEDKAIEFIKTKKLPLFKDKHKVQRRANAANHLGFHKVANTFIEHLNIMESIIISYDQFIFESNL